MKNILQSSKWISDLDETIKMNGALNDLSGSSIFITGCTGLIGSALVDLIIRWNETHNGKIIIFAAGRDIYKIENRFCPFCQKEWFHSVPYDASAHDNQLTDHFDYIIHGASNATPKTIMQAPVETMLDNVLGVKDLLDYANDTNAKRVLYISSSEVYGNKEREGPIEQNDYGWIDILNPRSSYSVAKCAAETMCASYFDEHNVSTVIVRPGHIYGPTAHMTDSRVSSMWAYTAAQGNEIVMKSEGSQIRSYCYCLDCATALLTVLIKGKDAHAYNISNPDSIITIRDMAILLAKAAGISLNMELPTESEKKAFNPMTNSSLDSTELLALGWRGLFDAERGFSHTVEILREMFQS